MSKAMLIIGDQLLSLSPTVLGMLGIAARYYRKNGYPAPYDGSAFPDVDKELKALENFIDGADRGLGELNDDTQ